MESSASFTIGKVTGVHGLNGNLKVWSYAQSIDTFASGSIVLLQTKKDPGREYTILKSAPHKKGVLLTLEGVDTRDLAESLMGYEIRIDREMLPEPEEDTWFWEDLIGLAVMDEHKGYIGTITDIFPTGANEVLVVTDPDKEAGKNEILVPMHKHFVASVDIDKQTMTTTLPEDYE